MSVASKVRCCPLFSLVSHSPPNRTTRLALFPGPQTPSVQPLNRRLCAPLRKARPGLAALPPLPFSTMSIRRSEPLEDHPVQRPASLTPGKPASSPGYRAYRAYRPRLTDPGYPMPGSERETLSPPPPHFLLVHGTITPPSLLPTLCLAHCADCFVIEPV